MSVWPKYVPLNQLFMKRIIFFVLLLSIVSFITHAQLISYPAPDVSVLNPDFSVKVRLKGHHWQSIPVYVAKVASVPATKTIIENTSFAYFDFSGEAEIAVTCNRKSVTEARIRPLADGIAHKITGNTIFFSLNRPCNLSVEVNGDIFHNLQLFANPLETFKPSRADTNVIYFGAGIHRIGTLKVPSNKTVYIAGGAVVQGQILIDKGENIRVIGRGILTQLLPETDKNKTAAPGKPIQQSRNDELTINFSKNVTVDGFIVLPHKYSIFIGQSQGVKISNFKSFSSEGNADGLDIFCSKDITIDNIFMRNADDCIAIYGHRWSFYGNTKNVKVSNSILWADVAHPILIGTHGDAQHPDTLGDMEFKNIDILDQRENQLDYQGCIALNAGDNNLISNIRFENIRIENIRKGQLVNLRVMYNHKYNEAPGRGVENIWFKDVSYTGNNAGISVIAGYDDSRAIKNVTFENLKINGTLITDDMPGKPSFYKTSDMGNIFIGEHVEGIKFTQSSNTALKK